MEEVETRICADAQRNQGTLKSGRSCDIAQLSIVNTISILSHVSKTCKGHQLAAPRYRPGPTVIGVDIPAVDIE